MHILIITSDIYTTDFNPIGAIFQRDQANALLNNGNKTGVLSVGYLPAEFLFKKNKYKKIDYKCEDGVNVFRAYTKKILPFRYIPAFWKRFIYTNLGIKVFRKYVSEFGLPDLIHAHNCFYGAVIAEVISRSFNIPFVVTEHNSQFLTENNLDSTVFYGNSISTKEKEMFFNIYSKCSKFVAVSNRLMNNIGDSLPKNFDKSKLDRIPNILDSNFSNVNIESFKNDKFTFLNIGSLIDLKNHSQLLEAFALGFSKKQNVQLFIGGVGSNLFKLQQQAEGLGISDKVKFLGYLDRKEVLKYMVECNAFVLPSLYETFGVVLIEALACGKPLIASACGGPNDIINDNNGILVPINDMHSLSQAMQKMYLNSNDYTPIQIQNDCLMKYGEDVIVAQLKDMYDKAIQSFNMNNV